MFLLALALFNRHRRGCVKNAKGHNTSLQDRVASLATCSILRNTRIFSITIIVRSQQTQAITVNTEYDDDDPLERDCGIDLTQGAPHHFVPGFSYLLQGRSSRGASHAALACSRSPLEYLEDILIKHLNQKNPKNLTT